MPTNEILMAPMSEIGPNVSRITCKVIESTPVLDATMLIIICLCVASLITALYMMVRLHFVSNLRRKLNEEWFAESKRLSKEGKNWKPALAWHESLPDFDDMMRAFWIWPVEKMVPESCASYTARVLKEEEEQAQSSAAEQSAANPQ